MDLTTYTDRLRDDLASAAALGDEQTRRTADALAHSLEPAARLLLMSALSELAAEVTATLDDRVVDVRLDGRDVRVVVTGTPPGVAATGSPPAEARSFEDVTGDISRVTLRVVEQVKAKAEQAASKEGVSLNSWLSQAVQGALRERGGAGGGVSFDKHGPAQHDGGAGPGAAGTLRGWVQG